MAGDLSALALKCWLLSANAKMDSENSIHLEAVMIMSSNRYCFYSQTDAKETRTLVFRIEKEMEFFLPKVIQITHQNCCQH